MAFVVVLARHACHVLRKRNEPADDVGGRRYQRAKCPAARGITAS